MIKVSLINNDREDNDKEENYSIKTTQLIITLSNNKNKNNYVYKSDNCNDTKLIIKIISLQKTVKGNQIIVL